MYPVSAGQQGQQMVQQGQQQQQQQPQQQQQQPQQKQQVQQQPNSDHSSDETRGERRFSDVFIAFQIRRADCVVLRGKWLEQDGGNAHHNEGEDQEEYAALLGYIESVSQRKPQASQTAADGSYEKTHRIPWMPWKKKTVRYDRNDEPIKAETARQTPEDWCVVPWLCDSPGS